MVLRLLVDLAQAELGARGQVVRIGGDEFLCVLPAATHAEAEALGKALSQRFDRAVVAAVDSPCPPSLSIGIATGSADKGLDRLIRQADEAMYIVKRSRHSNARTRKRLTRSRYDIGGRAPPANPCASERLGGTRVLTPIDCR